MRIPTRRQQRAAVALALAAATFGPAPADAQASPRHNAVIIVTDGLRAGSVNPTDAPTLSALANQGVRFANSHSLFPTFTTLNASAIATGHAPGDTGDFSNFIFTGHPLFGSGTVTPFLESDPTLADIDEHFGGNYLTEETLLACARRQGYNTAAIGKQGPTLIQDVTQGNRDNVSGTIPAPTTAIIDDSTGRPGGVPLSVAIAAALAQAGLAATAPDRTNGAAPASPQSNGFTGSSSTPGTRAANVVQQQYFTSAITQAILPAFRRSGRPFVLVYWSRDPDGTQHNQGDSLGRLTPGINGPTARAAVRNVDNNVAQILAALKSQGLDGNTDVFVTADHGFNTISKRELNAAGAVTTSYAARRTYPGVNAGFLPPGFLAIDLAHALGLPLYDPDAQVADAGGKKTFKTVDAAAGQRPAAGHGLLGGTGAVGASLDAPVVVAANGGSDLIYLPTGSRADREALARKIADFLSRQDYVSGLFADDALGPLPGALPLSAVNLKGGTGLPVPSLVVNFRSFATDAADPLNSGVVITDGTLQEGQGMHGSFDRACTFNFMAAVGPDFKRGYTDKAPVSNADVPVTLAAVLGLSITSHGSLRGRSLAESLAGRPDTPRASFKSGLVRSAPAANGLRTLLRFQQFGPHRYFDVAGFPGRTNGL